MLRLKLLDLSHQLLVHLSLDIWIKPFLKVCETVVLKLDEEVQNLCRVLLHLIQLVAPEQEKLDVLFVDLFEFLKDNHDRCGTLCQ